MAGSIELDLDDGEGEEGPWWAQHGYLAGKEIEGSKGLWICLANQITTYRLMLCGETAAEGVHEFWCYPHSLGVAFALQAFALFDGVGDPIDGWVKHFPSERRHPHPDYESG